MQVSQQESTPDISPILIPFPTETTSSVVLTLQLRNQYLFYLYCGNMENNYIYRLPYLLPLLYQPQQPRGFIADESRWIIPNQRSILYKEGYVPAVLQIVMQTSPLWIIADQSLPQVLTITVSQAGIGYRVSGTDCCLWLWLMAMSVESSI